MKFLYELPSFTKAKNEAKANLERDALLIYEGKLVSAAEVLEKANLTLNGRMYGHERVVQDCHL